jgi:hypothetical protein
VNRCSGEALFSNSSRYSTKHRFVTGRRGSDQGVMPSTLKSRVCIGRARLVAVVACIVLSLSLASAAPVLRVTTLKVPNPVPQGDAGFGESVAGLADTDGDGVGDLVVGAPGADRVYILSGATRSVLRTITDPNGSGHRFGVAVANAGDLNGDGVDDVAVGAPGPASSPIPLACPFPPCPVPDASFGRAFVFSGSTGALIRTFVPAEDFTGFGVSVASLGDANGDNVPDLAVGMVPLGFASSIGRVYAFSGSTAALLWKTDEPGGKQLPSFGFRITSVGDLTGDGRRDLLVSAPFHDVNPDPAITVLAGQVYLMSGATGAVVRTHSAPNPANNDGFGLGTAAVGDQDGDGADDYAIGDPGKENVFLVSGKTGSQAGVLTGPQPGERFGFSIASVGDQDADGFADFWIGAPDGNTAFLITWSGTTLAKAADAVPAPPSGGFAWSLAATQNLGGDNPADLIVGEPADGGGSGAVFIVLLAANKLPIAKAGLDQSIECAGPGGSAIVLDGSASSDPDGDSLTYEWRDASNTVVGTTAIVHLTLGLGSHTFTLDVSDAYGGIATDSVTVVVQDTTPPTLAIELTPAVLWPPNHRLATIAATVVATDKCDPSPTITLLSIVSSEPDNGLGDGDAVADVQDAAIGSFDTSFLLRAERAGTGPGRVYTVTYRATDDSSNSIDSVSTVTVPH